MNATALLPGDFITAAEFGGKTPTLTITDARLVKVFDEKTGGDKQKGTIFFRETPRGWILNRTNVLCLMAMFGSETNDWNGKRVTLAAELVQFGRDRVLGIRVKGSPDLLAPVLAEIKLPRKKPTTMRLVPTGHDQAAATDGADDAAA